MTLNGQLATLLKTSVVAGSEVVTVNILDHHQFSSCAKLTMLFAIPEAKD